MSMITGGAEITQSASEMGNAIKIMSMRLMGMKGKLEDIGEYADDVESISKIQTHILNTTQGQVNIFDDNGNFKSTYEILEDISKVWDKISKTDQADLLETIAGKQRGNSIAALIQSFQSGQTQKALEATQNAVGSAQQEQDRWMNSLEAKTQQFQAAFQSLSNTVVDSDILKFFVDLGTTGVSAIDSLTKTISPLGLAMTALGAGFGIKNVGRDNRYLVTYAYPC